MEHPPRYAEYRVSRSLFWVVAGTAILGLAAVLIPVAGEPVVVVPVVAVMAVFLVRVWSLATVTTPDHLVLRGLLRTRTIPWRDVQELRVESNPGAAFSRRAPGQVAVFYDRSGRSVTLANLNDSNLGGGGAQLFAEVEKIRRIWVQQRGADWVPAAAAQRKVAQQDRYGASPAFVGLRAAFIAIPVTIVLALVGLFTSADDVGSPLSWLFLPPSPWCCPS